MTSTLKTLLLRKVHPHVVRTILYDHETVEHRLNLFLDIEIVFEQEHGVDLFIDCDVEGRVVFYEVEEWGILVECSW
jgi:hypothetical protein